MKTRPHKGFLPKFYLDHEKNVIRGKVLNTKDTITFHGKTVAEAWAAFRDSVDDYIAFCGELGIEPEKPFNGKLLVRITPLMHRQLSLRAQQHGISINAFVKRQLDKALGRTPLQPGTIDDFDAVKKRLREAADKKRLSATADQPKPVKAKLKVGSGTK